MARNRFDIDEMLVSPFDLGHLKRCGKYIKKNLRGILLSILLSSAATISTLLIPQLMRIVIDEAIPNGDRGLVVRCALLMLLIILIFVTFVKARHLIMAKVGQAIIAEIRMDLFKHLQKLSFNYYDSRPHGKILVRVVQYVNSVSNMLSNGLIDFILELLNILFISIFMLATNRQLSLVILAGLPIFLIVMAIVSPIQRKAWQLNSNKNSNMVAYIAENINGVKVTQIFNR
jgi:ATP-binding cassette subfamily B protein